jgi:hypothetical protein
MRRWIDLRHHFGVAADLHNHERLNYGMIFFTVCLYEKRRKGWAAALRRGNAKPKLLS